MSRKYGCEAVQLGGDQTHCKRCNLVWDNNSVNIPDCKTDEELANSRTTTKGDTPKLSQFEQDELNRRNFARLKKSIKD